MGEGRLAVADRAPARPPFLYPPAPLFPYPPSPPSCAQIFLWLVNSSSLALAHARPAQTSPKNFKHPLLFIRRSKKYVFFFHEGYYEMHLYKKFQKSKNSVSLSNTNQKWFVRTFGPLGINPR
jgi:hypothetical protein